MLLKLFQFPRISFLLLLLLVAGFLSGLSHSRIIEEGEEMLRDNQIQFSYSTGLYSKASQSDENRGSGSGSGSGSMYVVSGRMVPQGPNPLHN
ncbi:hypothetical protein KFK09_018809 [Dendrobium nobile]|uniref:Uncharacterized protein n=1 Tax=Dendrobium nobile TaxID=94219 RepID=A0A8T3B282_DENNO|nr:hypothetical protein KFK09_018809 [Dendrobium nobile]